MLRRRVIAATAICLLAVVPGESVADTAGDVGAVRRALTKLPLSPGDRARCVGAPAALLAASNRVGGQRGSEMRAVLTTSADIARRVGYDLPRGLNVCRELNFNRTWLSANALPRPYGHVFEGGIIYEWYPGLGMRIMPLATFEKADALARGGQTEELVEALDGAMSIAAMRGGRLELEYLFPWSGLKPPLRSAMSAGTAIMAVVRAYDATGDVEWLNRGWGFANEVLALGDRDGDQIWFRHYEPAPWLRVLNSDLRTTYGLGFLVDATGDPDLTAAYQRSLQTILTRLPLYDTGGWTRYDEHRDADLNYHDVQTQLLKYLFWQTGDVTFDQWWTKFKAYRAAPPTLAAGAQAAPAYPTPIDGFRDHVEFPINVSKPARVTLTFRNASGAVAGQAVVRVPSGASTIDWSPTKGLAAGTYTVDARAVDLVNKAAAFPAATTIQIARDVTPPAIVSLGAYKRLLSWNVQDAETPWVTVDIRLASGRRIVLREQPLHGKFRLPAKAKAVGAQVTVRDSSGNAATGTAG